MTTLDELEARIASAMQIDRHRLGRQARSIRGAMQAQRPFDRELAKFTERLEQSIARREKRQTRLPPRIYDPALPITRRSSRSRKRFSGIARSWFAAKRVRASPLSCRKSAWMPAAASTA
ncbi:MAG: hypothetical protein R3C99_00980 [Pirellulaceae bacterium]